MKKKFIKILLLIILSLNLYACDNDDNQTNETNQTIQPANVLNLKSDDTRKVYLDNSTYHVYYYDKNNKITGYEQYVKYDYGVTASYIYGDIVEEYKKDADVDEISPVENYIKIKYKESKFKDLTLDSIKEEVSMYKEIY